MPETRKGKRTAKFQVQIVEDGGQIHMFFDGYDQPPINFNRGSGTSGPRAYEKLSKILDDAGAKETEDSSVPPS
jgi:hypothetical protein